MVGEEGGGGSQGSPTSLNLPPRFQHVAAEIRRHRTASPVFLCAAVVVLGDGGNTLTEQHGGNFPFRTLCCRSVTNR